MGAQLYDYCSHMPPAPPADPPLADASLALDDQLSRGQLAIDDFMTKCPGTGTATRAFLAVLLTTPADVHALDSRAQGSAWALGTSRASRGV